MEQALTQLDVKLLFDDFIYWDDDDHDDTKADTMKDVVYEVDSDDDLFWILRFNINIHKLPFSNVKQSSLFVSLYNLAFTHIKKYMKVSLFITCVTNIYWFDSMYWI